MSIPLPVAATVAGLLTAQAGGMDMAVAQKWAAAKVVKYRVDGVHKGRDAVVKGAGNWVWTYTPTLQQ